jgi:SsrA-binding protein
LFSLPKIWLFVNLLNFVYNSAAMPTITHNKRVRFDYTILEEYEAGLVLTGGEVKACKQGSVSLKGAFVVYEGGELWLKKAQISPYQLANQWDYNQFRNRKLLVQRKTINELMGKTKQTGLTLLPESLYTTRGLIKLKLVLARGKKRYDKRATLKKRDVDRSIGRALRQRM